MLCPHCKQEMPPPPPADRITVETLEGIADRTMAGDEFGIGRGRWTDRDCSTFTVSIREGRDYVYTFTAPLGSVFTMDRAEFKDRLATSQPGGSPAATAGEFGYEN